jgi:cytosine/creatinine deaminase
MPETSNGNRRVEDEILKTITHLPTKKLASLAEKDFFKKMDDRDYMRIAVFLAEKSYEEEGCPIGAVIVDNKTGLIVGKGHNVLVQENDPYGHGEVSAIRDAGRQDFSETTIFTSLSPCDVCRSLIEMLGFARVVVGDITNAAGNEDALRGRGIQIDVLEDPQGVGLYAIYRQEKPDLDLEDWRGLAAVKNK